MDKNKAITEITNIFSSYMTITSQDRNWLKGLKSCKVYELLCLSKVVEEMAVTYGYNVLFHQGPSGSPKVKFKGGPGHINLSEPHFSIVNRATGARFRIFVDIEFNTMSSNGTPSDNSGYHEADIIIVDYSVTSGRPDHEQIALAVECKEYAKFSKQILKEALGIRRELSLFAAHYPPTLRENSPLLHTDTTPIAATPPSDHWLFCTDPRVLNYCAGPESFGTHFYNLTP